MAQENYLQLPYQAIAESLLGRPITITDGIDLTVLEDEEKRLGLVIPSALKEFYQSVGKLPQFMSAFQLFALPEQLYLKDNLLVFLEENQGECYWAVNEQGNVLQCDEDNTSYELGFNLKNFLALMLYYQVAQGAEYSFCSNLLDQELALLYQEQGWQQVVNYDDLVIYQLSNYLIWYFKDDENNVLDDLVYFVSLVEIPDAIIKQYALETL